MTSRGPVLTATTRAPRPSSIAAWRQALRLPSFSATLAPLLVGSSYALVVGTFNPGLFLLMLVAAIACQAGANLANDYYDHRRGVDTVARPGSSKVIQQHLLSPTEVRLGMLVAFALATILGILIVALTSMTILYLALACLAVAVLYTAGPKPLGYVALGEVAVFLAMGLALPAGAFFALTGTLTPAAVLVALPNACLVTAILHVNNMRDIVRDRDAGKRTLAMLLGRTGSTLFYFSLVAAPYLLIVTIMVAMPYLWPLISVVLTLPRTIRLVRMVHGAESEQEFSRALRGGNRLLLDFGVLMSAAFVIVAVVGR